MKPARKTFMAWLETQNPRHKTVQPVPITGTVSGETATKSRTRRSRGRRRSQGWSSASEGASAPIHQVFVTVTLQPFESCPFTERASSDTRPRI